MNLQDTTEMMNSNCYKRFTAEFYQLLIRYDRLTTMFKNWESGELDFTPTCPKSTYELQAKAMSEYIAILEARAVMEGIYL